MNIVSKRISSIEKKNYFLDLFLDVNLFTKT